MKVKSKTLSLCQKENFQIQIMGIVNLQFIVKMHAVSLIPIFFSKKGFLNSKRRHNKKYDIFYIIHMTSI